MFGPLTFGESQSRPRAQNTANATVEKVPCMLCDEEFTLPDEKEPCLKHIFDEHQLVIGDVQRVADLPRYFEFWKSKLRQAPLKDFCSTILVDVTREGIVFSDQEFLLLSDIDKDDKMIREKLQKEKLAMALEQQKFERDDKTFSRCCCICGLIIEPTRTLYFQHLIESHNLFIANPNNLVYVDKLFTTLQNKMDNLQCIFCEKYFKDKTVMKEHMRKKGHKCINPNNEFYDQFFIINYLESGIKWKERENKNEPPEDGEEVTDWSDWEEEESPSVTCLFCNSSFPKFEETTNHLKDAHGFDYNTYTKDYDFYKKVKIVNYIRRQVYWNRCMICDETLSNKQDLLDHMKTEDHFTNPESDLWDKPEFFFPTYENDSFLCHLDNEGSDDEIVEINQVMSDAIFPSDKPVNQPTMGRMSFMFPSTSHS